MRRAECVHIIFHNLKLFVISSYDKVCFLSEVTIGLDWCGLGFLADADLFKLLLLPGKCFSIRYNGPVFY